MPNTAAYWVVALLRSLVSLRGQFIVDWFQGEAYKQFPFRLFDRERQLLKQGNFDAYNQWLFSSSNEAAYNNWADNNADQMKAFENYHRNVIFKPSSHEYYAHWCHVNAACKFVKVGKVEEKPV